MRARFIVEFETTLRRGTFDALSVPENYQRGAARIALPDELDKARYGRELPLSDEARAMLDAIIPESGLIFGTHDYRDQLKKAAVAVLPPQKTKTFTAYDLGTRYGELETEILALAVTHSADDQVTGGGGFAQRRLGVTLRGRRRFELE